DRQRRILCDHLDAFDRDQIAEDRLERGLDEELRAGRQLRAVGREDQLEDAAAPVRPHDALAGAGQEHLPDQIAHVLLGGRVRGQSSTAEAEREVDPEVVRGHVADTLGWTTTGRSPMPVGTQTAWPDWMRTGTPPARTRTAPMTHWAVAQGGADPVSAQPVIAYGEACVTTGCPLTVT